MKTKINNTGDPCRKCGTPVIKKECKFKEKKLEKSYYYTAYYACTGCKTTYYNNKFKIMNGVIKKKKPKRKQKPKKYIMPDRMTSQNYRGYLKSEHWKTRRENFLKTNKFCFCCGSIANIVHHRNYGNLGKEKNRDLILVCRDCHSEIHRLINEEGSKLKDAHIEVRANYLVEEFN